MFLKAARCLQSLCSLLLLLTFMFGVLQKDFILKALTGSCEVSLCNFRGGNFVQCVSGAVIELCACFSELTGQRRGRCCCGSCCRSSVRTHTRRLTHTQCVARADCIRPLCVVTVVPTCGLHAGRVSP